MEALMAGTVNAAEAGGLHDVGKLAPVMADDIIAMPQNPFDDIHAVTHVAFATRGGLVAKMPGGMK
jgi:imidazolonepropionase-like amidohydrolase